MTDYFALLGQPRKPWLDPKELKKKYHALVRSNQPDGNVNEAYRMLLDPKQRLQHLLNLEGVTAADEVPSELADLFMEIASVLNKIDRSDANQLTELIDRVQQQFDRALEEVRELDANWNAMLGALEKLYQRISYLTRWQALLEERRFQLSI